MTIRDNLVSAVTEWDRKQSCKRFYNPYGLGIMLERVNEVCKDIDAGTPIREAILGGFNDRLLDFELADKKRQLSELQSDKKEAEDHTF